MNQKQHTLGAYSDKRGIFFKDVIKQHNSLIIIASTNIDKSKVRQKSDKFLYFSNVKEKENLHNFLNINTLLHE